MTHQLLNLLSQLHEDESGATATEYIVLLVLVACFVIGVVRLFGETVENKLADANNAVSRQVTF